MIHFSDVDADHDIQLIFYHSIFTSDKIGYVFVVFVCLFVCLFVCPQDYI